MKHASLPGLALLVSAVGMVPVGASESGNERPTGSYEWGELEFRKESVILHVNHLPADRVVRMPRLHSPFRSLYLQSDPQKHPLRFHPEVTEWQITYPENAGVPDTIVVETVGPALADSHDCVIGPDEGGTYDLAAHHAAVHGTRLRYEPQPHKNTLGWWTDEHDWCEWTIDVPRSGRFFVDVWQGCGSGYGGSVVEIRIGRQSRTFTVQETGHFQKFVRRRIGTVCLNRTGRYTVQLRVVSRAAAAVMDVRQVQLIRLQD